MPILAGLKKADCMASRKKPTRARGIWRMRMEMQMRVRMATWAMAEPMMTLRFEKRSLIQPARGAKRTKGMAIMRPAADSTE